MKNKTGRPKGKKDSNKRLERDGIGKILAQKVEMLRNDGKTKKEIMEICNISESTIKKIIKIYQLKPMLSYNCFESEIKNLSSTYKICGIYCIAMYPKTDNIAKYYIGSSCDIIRRIKHHLNDLRKNKHYNKELQVAYENCSVRFYVVNLCSEKDLLRLENDFINSYCSGNLFNKWSNNKEDITKVLDRASKKINSNNYSISDNNCWIWKSKHKDGYGKSIEIGTTKDESLSRNKYYVKPHRVSYYKYNNKYPELIRHKCGNKLCVNPDHLESGSHRDNSKDKHIEKWKVFRDKYVEYNGDLEKLTEFFGYKKNYKASNGKWYYAGLPKIIKKLKIQ